MRRSADPAVGAAVAERAREARADGGESTSPPSPPSSSRRPTSPTTLLGELAVLQAEDAVIADEGLTVST